MSNLKYNTNNRSSVNYLNLLVFCCFSVFANTVYGIGCTGKIINMGILARESVLWVVLDAHQKPWTLCNLTDVMNNGGVEVKPTTCKNIYALLLTAKTSTQTVHFELIAPNTCDGTNSWSSLPFYNVNALN